MPPLPLEYQPPAPVVGNYTSMRVAALVARQARQVRLKKLHQTDFTPSNGFKCSDQYRSPSLATPTGSSPSHHVPFHEKKKLRLQLNMAVVSKPEVPPMLATVAPASYVANYNNGNLSEETPWEAMGDADLELNEPPPRRPRRQSSVTLSVNSPEGVEFQEVAHDGPEQLGKLTKRVKKLGKGAGGVVYLSLYLPSRKLVAVKEVVVYKEQERELVKHELHALHENLVPIDSSTTSSPTPTLSPGMWSELGHRLLGRSMPSSSSSQACPFLVAFYGAYLLPAKCAISIVMEFMDMGSLQDLLDAKVSVPEPIIRHCAFCCMKALEHMHRHRMIHRDIKPANILMNHMGEFKIADFGLAGTLSKSDSFFSEFEGTMMYMAPERIQGQPYTYVSDLWSMGVSLFYLATGAYPFTVEDGFFGLEETIVNDPLPPMPNRITPACRDFVKGLLQRDPNKRLTAAQALSHPFLHGYEGSSAFQSFGSLWEKMSLSHTAIKPEDVATIAQLLSDHKAKQQQQQQRRPSQRQSTSRRSYETPPPPAPTAMTTLFGQLSTVFSGSHHEASDPRAGRCDDELERLASDCGVTVNKLQEMVERAIQY